MHEKKEIESWAEVLACCVYVYACMCMYVHVCMYVQKIGYVWHTEKLEAFLRVEKRSENMSWELKPDRPIYAQLVEQIRRRIVSGEYRPGQRLDSVREMAAQAAVNPNTMQRALGELESLGLVNAVRTSGRFVTMDAALLDQARRTLAEDAANDYVAQVFELGFDADEAVSLAEAAALSFDRSSHDDETEGELK